MGRGGRRQERGAPERRCLVTGESQPKDGLVRFVIGPGDTVVPDILGRLPGRGLYVAADRATLEQAVRKRAFARGARRAVTVPDDLVGQVEQALARRVVELVSMARKAGQAVCGYEKTKDWLVGGDAEVLLQARDGSERGKAKLRPPERTGLRVEVLTADELGLAFGRESVIHGALSGGGLTTRVVEEAGRLAGLRREIGGDDAAGKD